MHDAGVVVVHTICVNPLRPFQEVMLMIRFNILLVNRHIVVSIWSGLFVPKSESMTELMNHNTFLKNVGQYSKIRIHAYITYI